MVKLNLSKEVFAFIQQAGDNYEQTVKDAVGRGLSYPKALNEAYIMAANSSTIEGTLADLSKPNNILGFHYMEAARNIGSEMKAVTIPRIVAQYHDDAIAGNQLRVQLASENPFLNQIRLGRLQTSSQIQLTKFYTAGKQKINHSETGHLSILSFVSQFYGKGLNVSR